jgi:hemerythrin
MLTWVENHALGYPQMDTTHQEFIDCVAALDAAKDAQVMDAFAQLKAHLIMHFDQEKTWMLETQFPASECHINEHNEVLKSVDQVEALLQSGDSLIHKRLAQELQNWFPGHADYLDSALAHWLCKRNFGGAPIVLRKFIAK